MRMKKIRYREKASGWWAVTHPNGKTYSVQPRVFRWIIGDVGDATEGVARVHRLGLLFLDGFTIDDELEPI